MCAPFCVPQGEYTVGAAASDTMLNSLMYKMSYYDFGKVRPPGLLLLLLLLQQHATLNHMRACGFMVQMRLCSGLRSSDKWPGSPSACCVSLGDTHVASHLLLPAGSVVSMHTRVRR
jgi:hypothetical protein